MIHRSFLTEIACDVQLPLLLTLKAWVLGLIITVMMLPQAVAGAFKRRVGAVLRGRRHMNER